MGGESGLAVYDEKSSSQKKMAIQQQIEQQVGQQEEQNQPLLLDALSFEEERREEEEDDGEEVVLETESKICSSRINVVERWEEEEELVSLFSKEEQQGHLCLSFVELDSAISVARREAVEWMLKVNAHYGFSALTAILSVNYLDRFLVSFHFQLDKPWMIQLVAVACLSLAAKVEETQVLYLLDLQVVYTKYVFEAKTIQRMELMVLSTLQWKMHPVTPLSFLDHIMRRLGMKTHLHWDFYPRCERLLLSVVADSRFLGYLPSVLAAATMMHVLDQLEPCNPSEYQDQLLGVLKISKEKVNACYSLMLELSKVCYGVHKPHKRQYERIPHTPSGVIDTVSNSDGSNDSWTVESSVHSSAEPLLKKRRANEQQMKRPSINRLLVGIDSSPP